MRKVGNRREVQWHAFTFHLISPVIHCYSARTLASEDCSLTAAWRITDLNETGGSVPVPWYQNLPWLHRSKTTQCSILSGSGLILDRALRKRNWRIPHQIQTRNEANVSIRRQTRRQYDFEASFRSWMRENVIDTAVPACSASLAENALNEFRTLRKAIYPVCSLHNNVFCVFV